MIMQIENGKAPELILREEDPITDKQKEPILARETPEDRLMISAITPSRKTKDWRRKEDSYTR